MEAYLQEKPAEELKPPVTSVGIIGWVRSNLFKGWLNSLLTIITIYCLWLIVPPLIRWAFIDSLWISTGAECQQSDGACWSIIPANIRFIIFGFFPYDQQWRPLVAMELLVVLLFYSRNRDHWKKSLAYAWTLGLFLIGVLMKGGLYGFFPHDQYWRPLVAMLLFVALLFFNRNSRDHWKKSLAYAWILGLFLMGLLMKGGLFGFSPVETAKWGGLPLTLTLSVIGLTLAYPLGIVFALGRRSKMPVVKTLCVLYIELIRGVPLISLLFMSSVVFPLFLPEGITINNILRAQVAIILFTAAYIAEVVRGGLQAMPRGQYEAADSIGLSYLPDHAVGYSSAGAKNSDTAFGAATDIGL